MNLTIEQRHLRFVTEVSSIVCGAWTTQHIELIARGDQ